MTIQSLSGLEIVIQQSSVFIPPLLSSVINYQSSANSHQLGSELKEGHTPLFTLHTTLVKLHFIVGFECATEDMMQW